MKKKVADLKTVAGCIVRGFGLTDDYTAAVHTRVRNMHARGLLRVGVDASTGWGTKTLDRVDAAKAALFHVLLDMGFAGELFQDLSRQMNRFNADAGKSEFASVLDALDTGCDVSLMIELRYGATPDRSRRLIAFLGHRQVSARVDSATTSRDEFEGIITPATTCVDMGVLLKRFLAEFDKATES